MNLTEKSDFLGTEKITKLIFKFSVPCILSLLISSLYNVVDQIFIGNSSLSALGNAATGVVFPVFIIAQAFAWCLGDGCAAYLNIKQGANDTEMAHKAIGGSITLAFLSGILMMGVIYPLSEPILTLFGASENTIGYATEYLNIILGAIPIYILANTLNSAIRADGSPLFAMLATLVGAAVNIVLDPVFIFALDMGMAGAAWATVIGQLASLALSVIYLCKSKTFRLYPRSFIPDKKATLAVISLGISTFITQLAIVLVTILSNVQLAKYGALSKYGVDIPIAIIGIVSKVFTVVIAFVVGIALGCQPIVSFNMGAKNSKRIKELYLKIIIANLAIGALFTALFELFPDFIIGIFGIPTNIPSPDYYWEFGELALRIFLSMTTVSCFIKTNSIFFQAAGRPKSAVAASMIREVICFIPLILILPKVYSSVESILFAAPLSDLVALVVTAILTLSFIRSLKE